MSYFPYISSYYHLFTYVVILSFITCSFFQQNGFSMASIHDTNKQFTYSNEDSNQYSELHTNALSIEGNVCSELFHPNQCLFFEQLTNVLLKEIEEQKTGLRKLTARFTKEIEEQKTGLAELTARFNSSQRELKTTKKEFKRAKKEINTYKEINSALNHKINHLEKYQIPPNLTNADVNPFFGERKDFGKSSFSKDDKVQGKKFETDYAKENDVDEWEHFKSIFDDVMTKIMQIPSILNQEDPTEKTGRSLQRLDSDHYRFDEEAIEPSRNFYDNYGYDGDWSQINNFVEQSYPSQSEYDQKWMTHIQNNLETFLPTKRKSIQNRQDINQFFSDIGFFLRTTGSVLAPIICPFSDGIACLFWAGVGITSGTNLVLNLYQDNDIRNLQSKLNDLEARLNALVSGSSGTNLEDRIKNVERLARNTGVTFGAICEAIDGIQTTRTGNKEFHCCLNVDDNKMQCKSGTIGDDIGIDTSLDNTCDTMATSPFCTPD